MSELYFMSDLHLNHRKMIEVNEENSVPYRPFSSVEEMNETIISNINDMVTDKDSLYILGDVVFQKASSEHLLARIKGKKTLILGNHDEIGQNSYYLKYFTKILMWQNFGNFVATHVPIRRDQFRKGSVLNLHGHVHKDSITGTDGPFYMNACVEVNDYKPISIEAVEHRAKNALLTL